MPEQEASAGTADISRTRGIERDLLRRTKYGGPEVSDAKRLKALEDENARLKKQLAEPILDMIMLKDVAATIGDARRKARGRRSFAQQFRCERNGGVWVMGADRSSVRHRANDLAMTMRKRLRELAAARRHAPAQCAPLTLALAGSVANISAGSTSLDTRIADAGGSWK